MQANQESAHFTGVHEFVLNESWSPSEYALHWHQPDEHVADEIPKGRSRHPQLTLTVQFDTIWSTWKSLQENFSLASILSCKVVPTYSSGSGLGEIESLLVRTYLYSIGIVEVFE